ncbi:MAG: M20 family metallopeptidase [Myxococcota bacterium]
MIRDLASATVARMIELRRDLHRHPELSWDEERTMSRISAHLTELGVSHRTGVAGTGIVADIQGREGGTAVALRADTDALPVHEETGLPFASQNPGVMHACGHDGHSSMLVGAAELLMANPPPVPVRLLWQPAEEVGRGALAMVEAGALEGVGMIFGGHVDRHYPPGTLVVTEGVVNASTDTFTVRFNGQQGHGGRPHESLDAVVVGSLFVTALQTIVSREVDPSHPSVVSVGRFDAGTAPNVIAGQAELQGTIRSHDRAVRDHLCGAIKRMAHAIGQLHGAKVEVEIIHGTPPLRNAALPTALARRAAVTVVGDANVEPLRVANMGGEDFAWYLDHVPGAYIRYGTQVEGREGFPAHSGGFDIHEGALAIGAQWLDQVARVAGEHLAGRTDAA